MIDPAEFASMTRIGADGEQIWRNSRRANIDFDAPCPASIPDRVWPARGSALRAHVLLVRARPGSDGAGIRGSALARGARLTRTSSQDEATAAHAHIGLVHLATEVAITVIAQRADADLAQRVRQLRSLLLWDRTPTKERTAAIAVHAARLRAAHPDWNRRRNPGLRELVTGSVTRSSTGLSPAAALHLLRAVTTRALLTDQETLHAALAETFDRSHRRTALETT